MAVALATALSALMAGGVWYYRSQAHSVRQKAVETLDDRPAQSPGDHDPAFGTGRCRDPDGAAGVGGRNPNLSETPPRHAQLRVRFEAHRRHYGYADVLLADAGGEPEPVRQARRARRIPKSSRRRSRERRPVLSELHGPRYPAPHISRGADSRRARGDGGRAVGAVILVCDAPVISTLWCRTGPPRAKRRKPRSRRENGHILFLNLPAPA